MMGNQLWRPIEEAECFVHSGKPRAEFRILKVSTMKHEDYYRFVFRGLDSGIICATEIRMICRIERVLGVANARQNRA
jgi:hypothetical protein